MTNQATTLISIESLINSHDLKLVELQKELSTYKAMLNDLLENNEDYVKASQEAGKLTKLKTIAKQKVLATPSAVSTVDKIKDISSQVKELRVALSDYLSQYVSLSGSNQFEGADGVTRQIVYSAKLVKKLD
jgi:hypothetical protein